MKKSRSINYELITIILLVVVFTTLKLAAVINWSWWLVTVPFWLGFAILFLIGMGYVLYAVISSKRKGK